MINSPHYTKSDYLFQKYSRKNFTCSGGTIFIKDVMVVNGECCMDISVLAGDTSQIYKATVKLRQRFKNYLNMEMRIWWTYNREQLKGMAHATIKNRNASFTRSDIRVILADIRHELEKGLDTHARLSIRWVVLVIENTVLRYKTRGL